MDNNSFFSIDRLVEFGMGIAVARQMVNTMNQTMQNMYVPGTMNQMQPPSGKPYYAALDGRQAGPFNEQEVMKLIAEHRVTKDTLVWTPGMPVWQPAEKVPEVLRLVALTPPPINQ